MMTLGRPRRIVKAKFVVFIGTLGNLHQVFVINSDPAEFIKDRPELMADQVPIDQESHRDVLVRDSYIDCCQLEDIPPQELEEALIKNMGNIKCCLSDAVRADVLAKVENGVNHMPLIKDFIIQALRP